MKKLTLEEIDFLKSKEFVLEDEFYTYKSGNQTIVLIPCEGMYKFEFYEWLDDGDGGVYEDYRKKYSEIGEPLESFIGKWF